MQHGKYNSAPEVNSIDGQSGAVTFSSLDGTVVFTPTGGNIDFSAPGGGSGGTPYYTWGAVTVNTNMVSGHGYIPNSASPLNFPLPASAAVGDHFKVIGYGAGGWTVSQNSGQTIHFGNANTTTGVGGSLASQNRYDGVEIICVVANTDFVVVDSIGNITGA